MYQRSLTTFFTRLFLIFTRSKMKWLNEEFSVINSGGSNVMNEQKRNEISFLAWHNFFCMEQDVLCRVELSHFSTRFSCVFPSFFPLHYIVAWWTYCDGWKRRRMWKKKLKNESDDQNPSNFSSHFLLKIIPFHELNFIPSRCFMMCLDSNLVDRMQLNFSSEIFDSIYISKLELRSFEPRRGLQVKSRST